MTATAHLKYNTKIVRKILYIYKVSTHTYRVRDICVWFIIGKANVENKKKKRQNEENEEKF